MIAGELALLSGDVARNLEIKRETLPEHQKATRYDLLLRYEDQMTSYKKTSTLFLFPCVSSVWIGVSRVKKQKGRVNEPRTSRRYNTRHSISIDLHSIPSRYP